MEKEVIGWNVRRSGPAVAPTAAGHFRVSAAITLQA